MTFMIWDSGITLAVKKSKGAVQLTLTQLLATARLWPYAWSRVTRVSEASAVGASSVMHGDRRH